MMTHCCGVFKTGVVLVDCLVGFFGELSGFIWQRRFGDRMHGMSLWIGILRGDGRNVQSTYTEVGT